MVVRRDRRVRGARDECLPESSIKGNAALNRAVQDYPEALKAFVGGELDLASGPGYLDGELFSLMIPLLLLLYTIAAGARAIAGEEEAGTLDLLLSHPISRTRLTLEEAGAMALQAGALAIGAAAALAVAGYMLDGLSRIVDVLEPWRVLSPFDWMGDPLRKGVDRGGTAGLVALTVVTIAVAPLLFNRRDIAV